MYGQLVGFALSGVVSITKKGFATDGLPRPVPLIRPIFLATSNGQFLAAVKGPSLLHEISLCQLGGLSEDLTLLLSHQSATRHQTVGWRCPHVNVLTST